MTAAKSRMNIIPSSLFIGRKILNASPLLVLWLLLLPYCIDSEPKQSGQRNLGSYVAQPLLMFFIHRG